MSINSNHVTGFVVGLGTAALGFYFYKKNQTRVDQWLQKKGIEVPQGSASDPGSMSVEELTARKERLEDLIAERETSSASDDGTPATPK